MFLGDLHPPDRLFKICWLLALCIWQVSPFSGLWLLLYYIGVILTSASWVRIDSLLCWERCFTSKRKPLVLAVSGVSFAAVLCCWSLLSGRSAILLLSSNELGFRLNGDLPDGEMLSLSGPTEIYNTPIPTPANPRHLGALKNKSAYIKPPGVCPQPREPKGCWKRQEGRPPPQLICQSIKGATGKRKRSQTRGCVQDDLMHSLHRRWDEGAANQRSAAYCRAPPGAGRGGRRSQVPSCSRKHNNRQGFKEAAG